MITEYQTITGKSESFFKEKGSKFYSFSFPVKDEQEVKKNIQALKIKFKDAGHHCYAFKLGVDGKNYRFSDDGEPNNTAGKPIYGQLNSFKVTNVLVVVVRYFGGTKLGVGGLIQAYKEGAKIALEKAELIIKEVTKQLQIHFKYEEMNSVMSLVKVFDLEILEQRFELDCEIVLVYPLKKEAALFQKITDYPNLVIKH